MPYFYFKITIKKKKEDGSGFDFMYSYMLNAHQVKWAFNAPVDPALGESVTVEYLRTNDELDEEYQTACELSRAWNLQYGPSSPLESDSDSDSDFNIFYHSDSPPPTPTSFEEEF